MHWITQAVLVVGVVALVGMAGYVTAYGLPERKPQQTAAERMSEASQQAEDALCKFYLSKPKSYFDADGQAERLRCASAQ